MGRHNERAAGVSAPPEHSHPYALYRRLLEHEDNLLGQRLGWLLASQAIFFGFYLDVANAPTPRVNAQAIPVIGLATAVLTGLGIYNGLFALRRIRREFLACLAAEPALHPPFLYPRTPLGLVGLAAPLGMPLLFTVAWLYFLVRPP